MIEYFSEIPLPGRVLMPPAAQNDSRGHEVQSLGFIAGAENRLVASAVHRLLQPTNVVSACKMIAFFGQPGTGKTHLAHGLVNHWNTNRKAGSATYLTAGDFYRGLLDAIKRDAVAEFHRELRNCQLLAIDDLHQLPGDEYVSRELRFTFDAFEDDGGIVVVTATRPADTLANLSAGLRSRLSAALSLQLAPPAGTTRIRIIRQASELLGRPLSEEAAANLASVVDGTANDLFGAVFDHCASLPDEQKLPMRFVRQPQLREIFAAVAQHFRISQKQLKSQSRRQSIVTARAVAIFLARELSGVSYEQIGRALGGRDHTTIIHSYRKIDQGRRRDSALQEAISVLSQRIRNG